MPVRRALCLALMLVAGGLSADEWPTWCHDLGRSGQASSPGPAQGVIAWAVDIGGSVDGSPIIVGEHVYVGNSDGKLLCLRRDSGATVWAFQTEGPVLGLHGQRRRIGLRAGCSDRGLRMAAPHRASGADSADLPR